MTLADALWRKVAAGADAARVDTGFAISRARVALAADDPSLALAQLDLARPATRKAMRSSVASSERAR